MAKPAPKAKRDARLDAQIEWRPTNSLKPYPKNARTHSPEQIDHLANSLQEFGQAKPILIDEKSVILAGHGTHMAAKKLGLPEMMVVVARGWTEAKKKSYRLLDNSLALESGWDAPLLLGEFVELERLEVKLVDFGLDILKDSLVVSAPAPLGGDEAEGDGEAGAPESAPKANRKTATIFVSVPRGRLDDARAAVSKALDRAKIAHSL